MNRQNMRHTSYHSKKIVSSSARVIPFNTIKRRAISTARELFYDSKCIEDLNNATTETEIKNIMTLARKRCFA